MAFYVLPKEESWGQKLIDALTPGITQAATARNQAYAQMMPLLFKAKLEQQLKEQELAQLPERMKAMSEAFGGGGFGGGAWKPTINPVTGEMTVTPYTQSEIAAQEAAGRRPQLANVLSYMQRSIAKGASPRGVLSMVRPERFATADEQTQLEKAMKMGLAARPKVSQAAQKRSIEIEELGNQAQGLIDLFTAAQREGKEKIPGFGAPGMESRVAGFESMLKGKMGELPYINVYNDKRRAFATVVAKAAGEVRPTDVDIERFLGTLPDLNKSDAENEILVNQFKNDIRSKGYKKMWKERSAKKGKTKSGIGFTIERD